MSRTQEEIQADIDKLEEAELNLASGKHVVDLVIGSGDFQRRYSYQEIDAAFLQRLLRRLYKELEDLLNTGTLLSDFSGKFRTHSIHIRRTF